MKTRSSLPKPPDSLSIEARRMWRQMLTEFTLQDSAALLLLGTACEAFDRMRAAQTELAKSGLTVTNSRGELRAHPATQIERDSRAGMMAALKALHLDLEPLAPTPGRQVGR